MCHENNASFQQSKNRSNSYTTLNSGTLNYHSAGKDVAGGRMKAKIDHFGEINNFINHTFPRFENNIKESFERVKEDSQELKEEFKKIREDLTEIKRKK